MKKQIRVRYLTFSRVALEIVTKLSDAENAEFNRILFSCFQQLEQDQPPEYEPTESPLLNVALQEAVGELQEGYKNYLQKVNARKNAEDQRSISDQSAMDQRSTIEEKRKDIEKKDEKILRSEGMQGGMPFNELEQAALNAAIRNAYLSPDPQFWSFAQKAGYRITLDAIRKATEMRTHEISYVVKLMRDAMQQGGI